MAKRKEIKFIRDGSTLTGRQDGVIFYIREDRERAETCAPAYYVAAHDTKERGRGISTHNHLYFNLDGAKEFCQKIIAGEIDLEAMRAEIESEDAAREQEKVRAATERARLFRDKLEAAGISYAALLDLWAAHDDLVDGLAHNILIGWERGEGWPSGT